MAKKKPEIKKTIAAIVCVEKDFGIGKGNDLIVNIPDDMKHFSRVTSGGVVIMGRKTYESLPNGALKKRTNLVITRNATGDPDNPDESGVTTITMDQAKEYLLQKAEKKEECKVFVIGGGEVYKELIPYCEMIYLTKVLRHFDADTYFPNLDHMPEWDLIQADDIQEYEGIKYQFRKYKNTKMIKREKPKAPRAKKKKES